MGDPRGDGNVQVLHRVASEDMFRNDWQTGAEFNTLTEDKRTLQLPPTVTNFRLVVRQLHTANKKPIYYQMAGSEQKTPIPNTSDYYFTQNISGSKIVFTADEGTKLESFSVPFVEIMDATTNIKALNPYTLAKIEDFNFKPREFIPDLKVLFVAMEHLKQTYRLQDFRLRYGPLFYTLTYELFPSLIKGRRISSGRTYPKLLALKIIYDVLKVEMDFDKQVPTRKKYIEQIETVIRKLDEEFELVAESSKISREFAKQLNHLLAHLQETNNFDQPLSGSNETPNSLLRSFRSLNNRILTNSRGDAGATDQAKSLIDFYITNFELISQLPRVQYNEMYTLQHVLACYAKLFGYKQRAVVNLHANIRVSVTGDL